MSRMLSTQDREQLTKEMREMTEIKERKHALEAALAGRVQG
jgi:hypothetical protein